MDLDSTAANIDVDDLTSEASITSAGNIQLSTTNTTGDKLTVFSLDMMTGDSLAAMNSSHK